MPAADPQVERLFSEQPARLRSVLMPFNPGFHLRTTCKDWLAPFGRKDRCLTLADIRRRNRGHVQMQQVRPGWASSRDPRHRSSLAAVFVGEKSSFHEKQRDRRQFIGCTGSRQLYLVGSALPVRLSARMRWSEDTRRAVVPTRAYDAAHAGQTIPGDASAW